MTAQQRQSQLQAYNLSLAKQQQNALAAAQKGQQHAGNPAAGGSPMMQANSAEAQVNMPASPAHMAQFYEQHNATLRAAAAAAVASAQGANSNPTAASNGAAGGANHNLQDYQMQLMLLEQQNKKRLMMARKEQEGRFSQLGVGEGNGALQQHTQNQPSQGAAPQTAGQQGPQSYAGMSPNPSQQQMPQRASNEGGKRGANRVNNNMPTAMSNTGNQQQGEKDNATPSSNAAGRDAVNRGPSPSVQNMANYQSGQMQIPQDPQQQMLFYKQMADMRNIMGNMPNSGFTQQPQYAQQQIGASQGHPFMANGVMMNGTNQHDQAALNAAIMRGQVPLQWQQLQQQQQILQQHQLNQIRAQQAAAMNGQNAKQMAANTAAQQQQQQQQQQNQMLPPQGPVQQSNRPQHSPSPSLSNAQPPTPTSTTNTKPPRKRDTERARKARDKVM